MIKNCRGCGVEIDPDKMKFIPVVGFGYCDTCIEARKERWINSGKLPKGSL